MPVAARVNTTIERLERGEVVFGTVFPNGEIEEAAAYAGLGYDFLVIDMEHDSFDPRVLRTVLQHLLDRGQIAASGGLSPDPVPFVRVPANSRERNQWIFKQVLDTGAYGIVIPQVETVEAAQAAVVACRYPQRRGAPDSHPAGERGFGPRLAQRYWGLSIEDYFEAADLWPLDPRGELLLTAIIETAKGVENLPDILANVKGIGGVWAGAGDLTLSLGYGVDFADPGVEEKVQEILRICQQHGVPCGTHCHTPDDVERRMEAGFKIITSSPTRTDPTLAAGKARRSR